MWKLCTIFFSTVLLLMLKKCKASHSLITVLLKVTVSMESWFSQNSSIAIIEKEISYYKRVSPPHALRDVFSLVKETRLCRVGRYYSLQLNAKAKAWEVRRHYSIYLVLFSRSKIKMSCPIDKWIVLQRVHCQILLPKSTGLCWSWNAGWVLIGADYRLILEI